jgi:hypothetical protein
MVRVCKKVNGWGFELVKNLNALKTGLPYMFFNKSYFLVLSCFFKIELGNLLEIRFTIAKICH